MTLLLLACDRDRAPAEDMAPGVTVHPDPRYFVREIEPNGTFNIDGPIDSLPLRRLVAVPAGTREVSYGRLEGADTEVLGGVDDVAVDGAGRIYVLDAKSSVVRVVDREGRYLASVGQAGQGPGDLFRPVSIAVDSRDRLLIGDMQRRIQRFEWRNGKVELDTVLPVPASPYAMCTTDSLIIAQGMGQTDSSLVQVYAYDGRPIRTFGRVYQSDDPMLNLSVQARLGCLDERGELVFGSKGFVPDLRVIGLDGRTRRLYTIADLKTTRVETGPDGSKSVRIPDDGTHVLISALPLAGGELLLQYGLITRQARNDGREYETVTTLLMHLATGAVMARDTTLPRYIARTRSGFIEVADSTVPQIRWHAAPP